jgi:hypothetical protein
VAARAEEDEPEKQELSHGTRPHGPIFGLVVELDQTCSTCQGRPILRIGRQSVPGPFNSVVHVLREVHQKSRLP